MMSEIIKFYNRPRRELTETPAPVNTSIFLDLAIRAITSSTVEYSSSLSRLRSLERKLAIVSEANLTGISKLTLEKEQF